eukprot:CAMPEP_0171352522 /NCGR_PEP_ID=MMETSP0878-20121228/41784_1 /TAXON_ID=67004 /ORGANISM="Thalassiosira weissflogii, Strain CCMP1336" /LENGTH=736 /DNA_ID=CAMNT_0011858175 /DNA_START=221 /DNA_END=2431 /DNA_ORIENTATION=+
MSTSISNKTDGNSLGSTADNDGKHSNGKQKNNNHQTKTTAPPPGYQHIHEGQIHMMYPQSENSVFYNPVQVQNRDLSVFMLGLYAERRMERLWVTRRKKELRRELLAAEEDENASEMKKESKSERKQRMERFERVLMDTLEKEKKEIDFNELVWQSSHGAQEKESAQKRDDANGNQEKKETMTSKYVRDDGMVVLDALAASGLRSLRYWKEVPGVRTVVVNDLDPVAIELARENVGRNGFMDDLVEGEGTNDKRIYISNKDKSNVNNSLRPKGIHLQVGDATHEMYLSRLPPSLYPHQCNPTQLHYQKPQYDAIDLDPYGSAAPFLDSAVQAIRNGGLLAVTCTDMAALGGSHPETCYGRYGAMPLQRSGYLQELALRILLYHLSVVAGRYGRTIRPVLSVGMAFYVRVFVEVYDDKAGVNNLSLNHGLVFQSTRCSSFHVTPMASNEFVQHHQRQQNEDVTSPNTNNKSKPRNIYKNGRGPHDLGEPSCRETGAPYKIAGPCWIGPLHDMDIVQRAITRLEAAKDNDDIDPAGGTPRYPLHTATTLHGLLVSVSEELIDVPLYHVLPNVCSAVNTTTIPMTMFRAALANAGYRSSAYHKEPQAVKTDAPNHVVWDIVRAWCKEHPPSQKKESKRHRKGEAPGSTGKNGHMEDDNEEGEACKADVATKILSREIETKVDFTIPEGFGLKKKARRFPVNPEANWGPKKAASGKNKRRLSDDGGDEMEKHNAKSSKHY